MLCDTKKLGGTPKIVEILVLTAHYWVYNEKIQTSSILEMNPEILHEFEWTHFLDPSQICC